VVVVAHFLLDNFFALAVVVVEIVHVVNLLMTEYEFVVSIPVVLIDEMGGMATNEAEVEVVGVVVVVKEAIMVAEVVALAEHVGDEFVG